MSVLAADSKTPRHRHRRRGRQRRFLAQSLLLEEVGPSQTLRASVLLAAAAILGLFAWAYLTPLAQSVATSGQIVPAGSVLAIQHWEGGIVRAIPVQEGELVEAGTVLVGLDPTAAEAEHDETLTRITALALRAERLRAFAEHRDPAFASVLPSGAFADLVADQAQIYQHQLSNRNNELQVLSHAIEQREAELATLLEEQKTLIEEIEIVERVAEIREELAQKGLLSRIVYLNTLQQVVSSRGELRSNRSEMIRVQRAIAEAQEKRARLDGMLQRDALTEMGEVTAEIAQLRRQLARSSDRLARLDIRAPVRGLVKSVMPHAIGGVVAPGSVVAEIVPVDDELIAEVKIAPEDVGQISLGQTVAIRVSAYDFYRYGDVEGELTRISASTFEQENGALYYKGIVRLNRPFVGGDAAENPILPGMTVQADINIGKRTVLEYLAGPIYSSITTSFGE